MERRDPRCVFVAETMGQASIVATFLEHQGLAAEVMNEASGGEALLFGAGGAPRGVEVWLLDPARVREAVGLLAEAEALRLTETDVPGQPIVVVCEECGAKLTFPSELRDSCQNCPECNAYVDVEVDPLAEPDGAEPRRAERRKHADDRITSGTQRAIQHESPERERMTSMDGRDPRCVFVAHKMSEAVVVASALNQQGFPAQVMDEATLGGLAGLTGWVPGVSITGVEVWVLDLDRVRDAVAFLAEAEATRAAVADEPGEPLVVDCDECGAKLTFPAQMRGTCQDCPECGAFVDVGMEDDEEWREAEDEITP